MFLGLLKLYLKSPDRPFLKSTISTGISLTLCIFPILVIVAADWIQNLISGWLHLWPSFNFGWFTGVFEWLLIAITWIIDNLTLLAMSAVIVVLGVVFVCCYLRRSTIKLLVVTYVFKRTTEPLLALHFTAWLVKYLIDFEAFYSLDHLLNDKGLLGFGSGTMIIVTALMWYMLALALNVQLSVIRKEKAKLGEVSISERIRVTMLAWIENRESNLSSTLKDPEDISALSSENMVKNQS